jgi:hypothetical protein
MPLDSKTSRILNEAILKLLRPLVHLLIKSGITYQTFAELAKLVYYDVAKKDFTLKRRKQTNSRISILTGMSRKDVKHLSTQLPPSVIDLNLQYNRGARVISGWLRDRRYLDKLGRTRSIPISGEKISFDSLVKRYGGDVPTRAVLDEMSRTGVIKITSKDRVRLVKDAFVPDAASDLKFKILGTDVSLLISTIAHNLETEKNVPYFQRKVSYDNLPEAYLSKIREMSERKANILLEVMDKYLASKDRDVNPKVRGEGRYQAGIGIYYFEKNYDEQGD